MKPSFIISLSASLLAYQVATAQQEPTVSKIRLASSGKVTIIQGTSFGVTTDGASVASGLYYNLSGDGWVTINPTGDDKLEVTMSELRKVDVAGSGKLESEGTIQTGDLELRVSGSGKIELDLRSKAVSVIISGSGKVELTGIADKLNVEISGSGKVDAEGLKVKSCVTNISGSGKCLVDVSDSLTSNISGSGSVYYVTPPAHVINNISGVGNVTDVDALDTDTTRVIIGKRKILIINSEGKDIRLSFKDTVMERKRDHTHAHWAGYEMGVNLLMNDDFKNDMPPGYNFLEQRPEKSIAINFNLVDFEVKLYRSNILLMTGLGFSINNYRFTSDEYLSPNTDSVTSIPGGALKKNKLVAQYITVPLLFEFNTSENPKKTFHLATGVIGGVRVASHVKFISSSDGDEVKQKVYDDFNLSPVRCDATVRLGYRDFTVFGNYDLVNFFKDNKTPELHAFTVGVRMIGW